jgi:hypothetical protein
MNLDRKTEIDRNYDFFQRNLTKLLGEHRGEFALLHDRQVIGWFDKVGDAYRRGLELYSDGAFSIQEADDRPAEMGLISLAFD